MTDILPISRRTFGAGLGALVATFPLKPLGASAQVAKGRLEGWIGVASDNTVTVFTGKAELGQGILTALAQIAEAQQAAVRTYLKWRQMADGSRVHGD
jgi:CO/xanthine dehydrogenase Mo-binding subunit